MEFLPVEINNEKVYAGFWKRVVAVIIDLLLLIFIIFCSYAVLGSSIASAVVNLIFSTLFFSVYIIYFHYRYGATLGKLIVGIKVTLPNGEKIGFRQSIMRSSVDLVFVVLVIFSEAYALLSVDSTIMFSDSVMVEKSGVLQQYHPFWYKYTELLNNFWYFSEFLVLLFNERRRAIHDFIAGTVVIHKKYSI